MLLSRVLLITGLTLIPVIAAVFYAFSREKNGSRRARRSVFRDPRPYLVSSLLLGMVMISLAIGRIGSGVLPDATAPENAERIANSELVVTERSDHRFAWRLHGTGVNSGGANDSGANSAGSR